MNIERMLVLSTAHVTEEVAQALSNGIQIPQLWPDPNERPVEQEIEDWFHDLTIYPHGEYGWLIYIPDQFDAEVPPCVEACMALAKANGCTWLLLDRDAEATDQLQTYEW